MIDRAISLIGPATHVMVFTGAGVSTASGIPDFRGPNGVWTRVDPADFTFDKYIGDADVRKRVWAGRRSSQLAEARPNPAHEAVTELWRAGRLAACVTQNIDGLHQAAGLPASEVIELHGNAHRCRCLGCRATWPMAEMLSRVAGGEEDPHCEHCGSIVKAAVVSFGEPMPVAELDRALAIADECDAVIAAGSTLGVYPAADVPVRAARRSVPYVVINRGETGHDAICDILIDGDVTEVLPALVAGLQR